MKKVMVPAIWYLGATIMVPLLSKGFEIIDTQFGLHALLIFLVILGFACSSLVIRFFFRRTG